MSTEGELSGIRVMVIADSNTIRRSAEIFLGKAGARVILAEARPSASPALVTEDAAQNRGD